MNPAKAKEELKTEFFRQFPSFIGQELPLTIKIIVDLSAPRVALGEKFVWEERNGLKFLRFF